MLRLMFSFACVLCAQAALALSIPHLSDAPPPANDLEHPSWQQALLLDEFSQVTPKQSAAPSRRTEVRLLQDGHKLYVMIHAFDPTPDQVVARQLRRDAGPLLSDDHVTLIVDVEGRGRNGFMFLVNALGTQYDSLIYDGGRQRRDWDAVWYSTAQREVDGWTARLIIPMSVFGVRSSSVESTWRVNAERWMVRGSERVRLAGIQADKEITSLSDALPVDTWVGGSTSWGMHVKPSVRVATTSAEETTTRMEPGVELFHQFNSDIRGAAAFNLDFGEAEVDDRVINLTRFELFRAEKREFFLRDAGRFTFGGLVEDSPIPYYSRRIGLDGSGRAHDLDAGLKLAGSWNGFDFGMIGARVPGDTDDADVGVWRVSRLLTPENRLGVIATVGNPEGASGSHLWGVDYQHRDTQWLGSRTIDANLWLQQSVNAGLGTGRAYGVSVDAPNLGFTGNAALQRVEENFLPALGFLSEAAVTRGYGEMGWWHRTARGGDVIPEVDWSFRRTLDGREQSTSVNAELSLQNAAGAYLFPEVVVETDRLAVGYEMLPGVGIAPGSYRWEYLSVGAGTESGRPWSLEATVRTGGYYDGRRNDQELSVLWQPAPFYGLSVSGARTDVTIDSHQFTAKTLTTRLDVTPSTSLGMSLLLQWDNVSDELGSSLRLRWRWRPTAEVFLSVDRLSYRGVERVAETDQTRALFKAVWNFDY